MTTKEERLAVIAAALGRTLSALSALAPRAATGYSDARQEEFRRDPRSLLGAGSVSPQRAFVTAPLRPTVPPHRPSMHMAAPLSALHA
jgi:hypothetical protein